MSTDPVASLFTARLLVPQPMVRVIARERVVALLDEVVHQHPLTVVVGGAGTGKTLAVAAWSTEGRPPAPVVWVSLDRGLRVPARFWAAVRRAVQAVVDPAALTGLRIPQHVDDEFVAMFAAAMGEAELCLVLDDVHELDGSDVWEGLDLLVHRRPAGLRLVLVSRHDPPLAVHRLRVSGGLGLVRGGDLAFTAPEAMRLLDVHGIRLPPAQFEQLMDTTEGWSAGLRLALLTLESAADPVEEAERFSGQVGIVAGYLMDEVIRGLDPVHARLLRRTAVCDRMCGPLAQALACEEGAGPMFVRLAHDNAFVVALEDSGWYRYHPLLLQMLRAQLHAEEPELERELHRRAALWFEDNGEWLPALEHALATRDWDLVASLSLRSSAVAMFSSARPELAVLVDAVPPQVAHDRADLLVVRALGAFGSDDHVAEGSLLAAADPLMDRLAEPLRTLARLNLLVLRAAAARRAGDALAMTAAATAATRLARTLDAATAPGWVAHAAATTGMTAIAELWRGHPRRAAELMAEASARGRPEDVDAYGSVYYHGHRALAAQVLGRLASAQDAARAALTVARDTGSEVRPETRAAHLALAAVHLQRGDADASAVALDAGRAASSSADDPFVRAALGAVAAQRALFLGDLPSARRHLAVTRAQLAMHPGMVIVERQCTAIEVQVELDCGATQQAELALAQHDPVVDGSRPRTALGEPDPIAVARARILVARASASAVRGAVAGQLDQEGAVGAEAWLVLALAEDRMRHEAAAIEALARAIELAAPEHARLPFLIPVARLSRLLRRHLDIVGTHQPFVSGLLASRSDRGPVDLPDLPLVDALTDRELSILAYLPTMSSNDEIAEGLRISVNTVKQHLKSVNRKLGVGSRRDAVRVARALGILPPEATIPLQLWSVVESTGRTTPPARKDTGDRERAQRHTT